MKWSLVAAAVVLGPIVVLLFLQRPLANEVREIWLPWAGIMASVAVLMDVAFRCLRSAESVTLKVLGLLGAVAVAVFGAYVLLRLDYPLVGIPLAAEGLICLVYAALLVRGIVRQGNGRFQFTLLTVLAVMLACGTSLGLCQWLVLQYGAIPFQYFWIRVADSGGMATIETDRFIVQFEGYSFGTHLSGGEYPVDGRHAVIAQPDPVVLHQPNGVGCGYSMQDRLLTVEYRGHRLTYSHPTQTVHFGGKKYSVAEDSLRFLVKRDGRIVIEPLRETAEEGWQRVRRSDPPEPPSQQEMEWKGSADSAQGGPADRQAG
jgi:hypothetical protein